MKFNIWYFLFFIIISKSSFAQEKVIGIIENDADSKPISNVHVINLNSVVGTISNKEGVFEIDAKNVPISNSYRYSIPGLPTKGYEAGSRNPGAISKVFGAIFNPVDFLYNLFGKKPKQLKKLQLMKDDFRIRELLNTKFDRETLVELLQIQKFDLDEILRNCSYSESFILGANDLQILEAISQCYEEFKLLNRK